MALGVLNSYEGSSSISTTEFSLPGATTSGVPLAKTDDGVVELFLDLNAMVAGDVYELKVYEKVQSGGTQRQVGVTRFFEGAQGSAHTRIYIGVLLHGWDITLKRTAGADRTIGWSIRAAY